MPPVVGEDGGRADDVGARQQRDGVGPAVELEVQPTRNLVAGRVERRDGEAEERAERLRNFGNRGGDRVNREEWGPAQAHDGRLDEGNLDLGEAVRAEDRLDAVRQRRRRACRRGRGASRRPRRKAQKGSFSPSLAQPRGLMELNSTPTLSR